MVRLTGSITSDPIAQQIKLHTSRMEIESDGFGRLYGFARVRRTLQSGISAAIKNADAALKNEKVAYTSEYSADCKNNKFQNGILDGFGIAQNVLSGLDTSIDLVLGISYYVKGIQTGDIHFEIDTIPIEDGFVYDGTYGDAIVESFVQIEPVITPSNLVRKSITFKIPVNTLSGNSGVVINLHRHGDLASDTVAADVIVTNVVLDGYFWHV